MGIVDNGYDVFKLQDPQFKKLIATLEKINNASGSTKNSEYQKNLEAAKKEGEAREDNTDALEANQKALQQQTRGLRGQVRDQRELEDSSAKLRRAYISHGKGVEKNYGAFRDLSKSLDKSGKSIKEQSALLSGLLEASSLQNDAADEFAEKMVNSSKSLQILNKNFLKYEAAHGRASTKQIKNMNDLERAQRLLGKQVNVLQHAYKGAGKKLKESLDHISSLHEDQRSDEEKLVFRYAENAGLIGKSNRQIEAYIKNSKSELGIMTKRAFYETESAKAIEDFKHKIKDASAMLAFLTAGPLPNLAAGFVLLGAGIKGAWNQLKVITESGMAGHWVELKTSQIKLGISFDQAAKLFAEHARILSVVGDKHFTDSINTAESSLMKMGLSTDQATQAAATFMETTAKAGINIKNEARLNKSIKAQSEAFEKMRATTGTTIDEFKSMQEELVGNTDIQSILYGINEKDRDQKITDMMALRQKFAQLGMSAQTAQKAMISMQELSSQKVTSRFEQSAKLQQALMIAGVGNAAEIANIHRKGKRASQGEQEQLASALGSFTKWQDQQAQGSYMGELIGDVMGEQISAFKPLIDATREGGLASDAGTAMSKAAVESNIKLAAISETLADIKKIESVFESIWNDPIVKIVGGIGIIALGLIKLLVPLNKMVGSLTAIKEKVLATSATSGTSVNDELGEARGNVEDELGQNGKKKKKTKGSPNKNRGKVKAGGKAGTVARLASGSMGKVSECCDGTGIGKTVADELGEAIKKDKKNGWAEMGKQAKKVSVESELGTKAPDKMIQGMSNAAKSLTQEVVQGEAQVVAKRKLFEGFASKALAGVRGFINGPVGIITTGVMIGDALLDVGKSYYQGLKAQEESGTLNTLQSWVVSVGDTIVGISDSFKNIGDAIDEKIANGDSLTAIEGIFLFFKNIATGVGKIIDGVKHLWDKAIEGWKLIFGLFGGGEWLDRQINSIKKDMEGDLKDQVQAKADKQRAETKAREAEVKSQKEVDATEKKSAEAKAKSSSADYIGEMPASALSASGLYSDAWSKANVNADSAPKVESEKRKQEQAAADAKAEKIAINRKDTDEYNAQIKSMQEEHALVEKTMVEQKMTKLAPGDKNIVNGNDIELPNGQGYTNADTIAKYAKRDGEIKETIKNIGGFLAYTIGEGGSNLIDAWKTSPAEKTQPTITSNPAEASASTSAASTAAAAKVISENKTSTSSAKMPKTSEEYLASIESLLTKNNEINNQLCDTSEKQLDMLESLVATNQQAREELQRRIGPGHTIEDYLNSGYSKISSMRSGIAK